MDGAIIAAVGDYVRNGNIERWPGIRGYDANPIFTATSAGPITEETLINAPYWAEKTLSVRASTRLTEELKSRNANRTSLSAVLPRDPLLLTSTNVVVPWGEMDTYSKWDKHRFISPFLPVYYSNQASNALLVAWTGPSGGGSMALFTLGAAGIDGNFAPWVGSLIKDINQKIIFIADDELRVNEIVTRFSRVGYDHTLGYLNGGLRDWIAYGYEVDKIGSISAHLFAKKA